MICQIIGCRGAEADSGGSVRSGAPAGQQVAHYSSFDNLFRWNGATWSKLQNTAGSCRVTDAIGVNGTVHAMDTQRSLCDGSFLGLWVAGEFSMAGGGSAWNLSVWRETGNDAYWDTSEQPSIISPSNGGTYTGSVTVSASFNTACSRQVAFYEGNVLLRQITAPPYSFGWLAAKGNHNVIAVATDANGKISVSQPITFRIQ